MSYDWIEWLFVWYSCYMSWFLVKYDVVVINGLVLEKWLCVWGLWIDVVMLLGIECGYFLLSLCDEGLCVVLLK